MLAGARKAAQDLHVRTPDLGAQSESDISGQISILQNSVAGKPAAVVISSTQFAALGKPIDAAAKSVKVIGIDSGADSQAFTSFLTTGNVAGDRAAALAQSIGAKNGGKIEGGVALTTSLPGVGSLDQRAKGFKEALAKYPGRKRGEPAERQPVLAPYHRCFDHSHRLLRSIAATALGPQKSSCPDH